jgi:hypothetical protein
MPQADLTFHVANLIVIALVSWKVVRAANRVESVLKDFPPHRHSNGHILFPKGFEPTRVYEMHDHD